MSSDHSSSGLKQIVRRLVRPVTSPIDGRVADINSRVDHTARAVERLDGAVERLDRAVSAFSEAATESSSYVGVELGRMAGAIEGLEAKVELYAPRGQELEYRQRLSDAEGRPLAELDGALAGLLNHSAGHLGFAAQAELWFNPPITVELSEGAARLSGVNERIVEIPFAMMALSRVSPGAPILDVGSAESTFPLTAASLGYEVTAVDPRGLPYEHPNLHVAAMRFEDLPAPANRFQAVFLISTIEHVGLPAYGIVPRGPVEPGAGADRELLDRVRGELLTDSGVVVITTPYAERSSVNDFERTYDAESIDRLLEGWTILERRVVTRQGPTVWASSAPAEAGDDAGVTMLVATPGA